MTTFFTTLLPYVVPPECENFPSLISQLFVRKFLLFLTDSYQQSFHNSYLHLSLLIRRMLCPGAWQHLSGEPRFRYYHHVWGNCSAWIEIRTLSWFRTHLFVRWVLNSPDFLSRPCLSCRFPILISGLFTIHILIKASPFVDGTTLLEIFSW